MNNPENIINFRRRLDWEKFDLGTRLLSQRIFFYMSLCFVVMLPLYILLALIFVQDPGWCYFFIWWLKPILDAGIIFVLHKQSVGENLSFWRSVLITYRLLIRPRIIGDLLWRRFSPRRAIVLPITVLEKLSGVKYRRRKRQIAYKAFGRSTYLVLFAYNFEWILLYGFITVLGWIIFKDLASDFFISDIKRFSDILNALEAFFLMVNEHWIWHIFNLIYLFIVSFLEPFFVAMCFGFYLHSSAEIKSLDIESSFIQLSERLRKSALPILIAFSFSGAIFLSNPSYAEVPPDPQQVEQLRKQTIESKPFGRIETKPIRVAKESSKYKPHSTVHVDRTLGRVLSIISIFILIAILIYFGRKILPMQTVYEGYKPIERIFGMDVRKDSLPENLSDEARLLVNIDLRSAISLLYRGLLVHLIHHEKVLLKDSMTENEIKSLIDEKYQHISTIIAKFTDVRIQSAYAHILPDKEYILHLCDEYDALVASKSLNGEA